MHFGHTMYILWKQMYPFFFSAVDQIIRQRGGEQLVVIKYVESRSLVAISSQLAPHKLPLRFLPVSVPVRGVVLCDNA